METPSEHSTETVETNPETHEAPTSGADEEKSPSPADGKTPRAKKSKPALTPEMTADPVSRKLFLYSKVFAVLAIVCIGFLTSIYIKKWRANRPHATEITVTESELFKFEKEQIQVVLSNQQDLRVVIAFECTRKAACEYLKEHPEQIDDLLVPILNSIDPLTLQSAPSKKLLRQKIVDQLNTLELDGKVVEANFTELSLEGTASKKSGTDSTHE